MLYVIFNHMSLSYTITPFHPNISYTGQVQTELELANANFTTLAQAFINQDPTSLTVLYSVNSLTVGGYTVSSTPAPNVLLPLDANGQFPASVIPGEVSSNGYANPINLSSATADYSLPVGAVAYISFTNATSVSLCIATTNGTYYEMSVVSSNSSRTSGTASPIYLNPNNTSYSNAFSYLEAYVQSGGSSSGDIITYSAFRIGMAIGNAKVFIHNFTTNKNILGISSDAGTSTSPVIRVYTNQWNDTTTSWTSLGTVIFPQATSGYILVRRKA